MAKRKSTARVRRRARKTTKKSPTRRTSRSTGRRAVRRPPRAQRARAGGRRTPAVRKAAVRKAAVKKATAKKAVVRRGATRRPSKASPPARIRATPAGLQRERRRLQEGEAAASSPSTLGYTQKASPAGSGHEHYRQRLRTHGGEDRALTSGDLDADWNEAYSSGEETPGGDMQTPDQDIVDEIGLALGVEYDDTEELKGSEKIEQRDKHRWEYDPASSEDYDDREKK